MPFVELEDKEWQQVLGLLAEAPWRIVNPLLMKIGAQLQPQPPSPIMSQQRRDSDGKEVGHE